MASMALLDKLICYIGILIGVFGIIFSIYMFVTLNGIIDAIHDTAISEADSAIGIMHDAETIVATTSASMDSLVVFAKNASSTLNQSAGSLDSMGGAIGTLASSLSSVPYMPSEATGPLQAASAGLVDTAASMRTTAASMASVSDNSLSAVTGVLSLRQNIQDSIASLEDMKRQIDSIQNTVKTGILIGVILVVLLFALNILNYYKQLTGIPRD